MSKPKRRQYISDKKVQGALAFRLVVYWFLSWTVVAGLAVSVAIFFSMIIENVQTWQLLERMASYLWFPLVISVMVLPILVRDCMRLSNRFAGPVLRFRRAMKQLADGETVRQDARVSLSKGDDASCPVLSNSPAVSKARKSHFSCDQVQEACWIRWCYSRRTTTLCCPTPA